MAYYRVICVFEVCAELLVEAKSVEEAESLARNSFDPSDYSTETHINAGEEVDLKNLGPDEIADIVRISDVS